MKKNIAIAVFVLMLGSVQNISAQYYFKNAEINDFQKREFNHGFHFNFNTEREETRTEFWREYEKLNIGAVKFRMQNRFWNFMDYKQ